ncbi:MAG: LysM peptidoglycan-binding domain-containing protein [Bacteriovoracaceae bacterium]
MKLLNIILIMMISFGIASCSSKKKNDQEKAAPSMETTLDNEVVIDDILEAEQPTESMAEEASTSGMDLSGEMASYTVEEGDTLMLISFKLYGDYRKWREIANQNPELSPNALKQGTVLNYKAPSEKFVWNPEGIAHLIRQGETLGTISNEKYGTPKKWRDIWENNKPMIINPNLIFAGFTLYYKPLEEMVTQIKN